MSVSGRHKGEPADTELLATTALVIDGGLSPQPDGIALRPRDPHCVRAAAPAELVTDWARRYLRGSGLFAKVFPTAEGNADLTLAGVIHQFEEADHEQTWEAALSIDFLHHGHFPRSFFRLQHDLTHHNG